MPQMLFLAELKKFLLEQGHIYTVRKFMMVEKVIMVEGVGACRRIPCGPIYGMESLTPFQVANSGFSTVEEWWAKIRYFIPNKRGPMYLYHVVKIHPPLTKP